MINKVWLTIGQIAAWGICGHRIDPKQIQALVDVSGLEPLPQGRRGDPVAVQDQRWDAEQVRIAYEAENGVPATTRGEIPGSKASQRRAPVARQVKQVKPPKQSGVFHDCAVCGTSFEAAYMAHGHLSTRKTCSYACMAILQSRNAAATRGNDWNVSIVPSQKVLSGESTG